jgi:Type I phosphodiesterase / nucleotide pyrophosphatase
MQPERRLPAYGGRCFDALPGTIGGLFSGRPGGLVEGRYDRVVLVYFDAFGWRFFERHGGHRLFRNAEATQLTSQFPSTTAVHSTTINTGLPLAQHGLYEWFVYEPRLDRLIAPLPFSFAGDSERDTLFAAGLEPTDLIPFETFYRQLDVPSFATLPALVALAPISRRLLDGATVHGFSEPGEGAAWLAGRLAGQERAYGTIYLPALDALMHLEGPDSASVEPLVEETLSALEAAPWPEGTLLLLTADHGCAAISPERTTYVNVAWPGIEQHLARGADGKPLAPAGSARDLFLHVLPDRLDDVADRLGRLLEGKADVERVDALLDAGVFGPDVSANLSSRLANLVVLAHADEAVYWFEAGRFEQKFHGQHGGLSPDEMDIPLVSWTA